MNMLLHAAVFHTTQRSTSREIEFPALHSALKHNPTVAALTFLADFEWRADLCVVLQPVSSRARQPPRFLANCSIHQIEGNQSSEAMISAEVYPLKSRNLVEDEDEEFPTPPPQPMHLVADNAAAAPDQRPSCLVVQLDNTASALVSSIAQQTRSQKVGHIAQEGRQAPAGEIFQSEACRILQFKERPAPEVCFELVREIMGAGYTSVVVLDAMPSVGYIGSGAAGAHVPIRYMASTAALKQPSAQTDLASVLELDAGNIVAGLAAGLLNHCENRNIPAVAFFVLRETSLTLPAVQALHASLPLFQRFLQLPDGLAVPDEREELRLVQRDPYIANTAILYV